LARVQPPFQPSIVAAGEPFVLLERAPGNVALIAEATVSAPAGTPGGAVVADGSVLFVSRDAGRSWRTLAAPCTTVSGLRSQDGLHAWVLCAAGGSAGNQAKAVYVSGDDGHTWETRANNAPSANTNPVVGSIPFAGYADTLIVPSNELGLIGTGYTAGIIRSSDGGRSWNVISISDVCIGAGFSITQLWFVTPLVGWAAANNPVDPAYTGCPDLLTTSDGGLTWTPLATPFQ
jgi:photosystem II stability/assembly factor-like uncharacterized protein